MLLEGFQVGDYVIQLQVMVALSSSLHVGFQVHVCGMLCIGNTVKYVIQ